MADPIDISQSSMVNLDLKTLVGIVILVLAMGAGYFKLQGQIATLQLDVVRMQDQVSMNTEFRIKWPRGELGALPDDAKQDLKIEYLQKELFDLREDLEELEDKQGVMRQLGTAPGVFTRTRGLIFGLTKKGGET